MPRVDVWDIPEDKEVEAVWIGYRRGLADKYELGPVLGEGGFGSVRVVRQRSTGAELACKSISKRLDVPGLAPIKQQQHLENIKREVLILRKLRGTLNVVHLDGAFEDETHVHIIMEYCRGGELFHKMGMRHYSERTVASYMRAVLRTLTQCHAHKILHRDIKPGNFMLLTEAEDAPLKAIDFGLAVFFDPAKLPRTDLGLEGTPWYMAPEVLSSSVEPASDVWAAGVMAYQLLSGRFPFDDWAHPEAPALSMVWRSILSEQPSFKGSSWKEISQPAKDFCSSLLNKDPSSRPSARDALKHPWLQKGNVKQRLQGTQLTQVVQRLQRHSQQNAFRKTVLDMMANELMARHVARIKEAEQEGEQQQQQQQQQHKGATAAAIQVPASPAAAAAPVQPSPRPSPGALAAAVAAAAALPAGSPVETGAAGGVRPLSALLPGVAAGVVVRPQYAEGSVHRQQQLLRLIPPKRVHSSAALDQEGSVSKAARVLNPSWHGVSAGQGAAAAAGGAGSGGGGRLEGTWHGPGAVSLRQPLSFSIPPAAAGGDGGDLAAQSFSGWVQPSEGSVRRGAGSMRGASSALEALRRARERAAAAAAGGGSEAPGDELAAATAAAPGAAVSSLGPAVASPVRSGVLPAPRGSPRPPAPGTTAAAAASDGTATGAGDGGDASQSYRGPVRDASTASLWDLQFMANRLAMEGSAHGNAYAHKLLRAASVHSRTSAAAAMLPQPQPLQQQQQQPRGGPAPADLLQQLQRVQQEVSQPQQDSLHVHAAQRLEGTWHGPSSSSLAAQGRHASFSIGVGARAHIADAREEARDRSWHGSTHLMRSLSERDDRLGGSKAASERQEFLRFLEAARRQRQEQRKVARLVLEGSTHGGVQFFLPARSTSSVPVSSPCQAMAAVAAAGGGSMRGGTRAAAAAAAGGDELDDVSEDDEDDEDDVASFSSRPSAGSRASVPSTPGGSGRGGNAAPAAAASQQEAGDGGSSREGSRHGLFGKLRSSFKSLIPTPAGPASAAAAPGSSKGSLGRSTPGNGSASGSFDDLNKLACESLMPPASFGDRAAAAPGGSGGGGGARFSHGSGGSGLLSPQHSSQQAGLGAPPSEGEGRVPRPQRAVLAEQILDMQGPEQAGLETRRRGQGAYAALMAATDDMQWQPTQPEQPQQQPQAAGTQQRHSLLPRPGSTAPAAAAQEPLPPKSAPQHVGYAALPTSQTQQQQARLGGSSLVPTPATAAMPPRPAALGATPQPGRGVLPAGAGGSTAVAPEPPAAQPPAPAAAAAQMQPAAPVAHSAPAPPSPPPAAAAAAAAAGPLAHVLPMLDDVQQLLDALEYGAADFITVEQLQHGLASLGYNLEPSEVLELARNLGYGVEGSEGVALSQFAASQLDWEALQVNHREEWLQCLRSTFDAMDADRDGRLKRTEILEALRDKLPEAEVNAAIEDVLLEAAADADEGLDFAAFSMLASLPADSARVSLDQYDARLGARGAGADGGASGSEGGSVRGQGEAARLLRPVLEADS